MKVTTAVLLQSYRESVPQDQQLDSEVMRISATDIDDGNNSIVLYKLEPKQEADQGYLRIDANTGVIFLNRTINVSCKNCSEFYDDFFYIFYTHIDEQLIDKFEACV